MKKGMLSLQYKFNRFFADVSYFPYTRFFKGNRFFERSISVG